MESTTDTTTITDATLMSMDEAIEQRLNEIALREQERQEAARREDERRARVRLNFAVVLSQRIVNQYGVSIDASILHDHLCHDHSDTYRLRMPLTDDPDGHAPIVMMPYAMPYECLKRGDDLCWLGLHPANGHFHRCETRDFVEAITFAKTGKQ